MNPAEELRRMGIPADLIATATVDGKPIGEVEPKRVDKDRMNKTEARFSWELEALKRAGEITRWDFQPLKFRLAKKTWFTPDFVAWLPDGKVWIIEIKGGHVRDDAAVKFKMAREIYPEFKWTCLQKTKHDWKELFRCGPGASLMMG